MSDYLESAEFIDHFLNKDTRAISALFERFYESLFAFSKSITRNDIQSEDIVNQSFLTLYKETARFEQGHTSLKNLKNFIFLVVRNTSFDYLKSKNHANHCLTVEFETSVDIHDHSIEHEIFKREVYRQLYKGLEQLPAERRTALELIYFEGRSYKQAAKIMGISLDQFKSYRKKAFAEIKEYIPQENYQYVFTSILLLIVANTFLSLLLAK